MANYTKTTDFAAKDTLPGGDTNKVVRGAEFETEFDAISTAIATKADTASPTFTGTVTIPTADINGGNIDGTVIGASTAAAGTFTNLVVTSADINGGTVDGATIGGSSAGAGTFTNLTASGTVNFSGATISNLGTITTANLDGGTVDNAVIGGATPAAGTFTNLTANTSFTSGNVDINGGAIDGTVIGASSAAAGTFAAIAGTTGTFSGAVTGSNLNVSNWDTAFGWGNHASAGYLTSVGFSDIDAGAITLSSETFVDSDTQIPTNAAVIDYVAATIPTISEVNDLSTVVTWATVPDAFISESSVNQHVSVDKATQTKTYTNGETSTITLSSAITSGVPVVSVTKEVPQTGVTNNTWDVDSTAENYTRYNTAPATTLDFVGFDVLTASFVDSFSLASQDATPTDLAFSADGTKMFVVGLVGQDINEYTLSTAFDVSTTAYSQTFSVASEDTSPQSIAFNTDGTKMFLVGNSGDDVNEYTLSTGFDVSTASFSQNFSISSQDTNPRGITFNADGTKMFVVGTKSPASVYEYNVSTGFDVSTASYSQSFSISSQDAAPRGIAFNSDGTKMFVVGETGDDVNEYTLSTGFDVSTASFVDSFSVAAQDTAPRGIAFNTSGTKMFICGITGDSVYEYLTVNSLALGTGSFASADVGKTIEANDGTFVLTSTAGAFTQTTEPTSYDQVASGSWEMYGVVYNTTDGDLELSGGLLNKGDISTAVYEKAFSVSGQGSTILGLAFKPDGTEMFVTFDNNDDIVQYTLSTAWDISTASYTRYIGNGQDSTPAGISFNNDGTKLFLVGYANDAVYEYELSTAYNIGTASYQRNFNLSPYTSQPYDIAFNADGSKMFIADNVSLRVLQFSLSTPFNVTTAGTFVSFSIASQMAQAYGITFNSDGTTMYVSETGDIFQYTLSTAYDISTASYASKTLSTSGNVTNPTALFLKSDDNAIFVADYSNSDVSEYSMGIEAVLTGYHAAHTTTSTDSQFWTDINSMTADEAAGDGNVYYAVSTDDRTTWKIAKSTDGERSIVRNNSGTWQYNTAVSVTGGSLTNGSYLSTGVIASQAISDFMWRSNGTVLFLLDNTGDSVRKYTASTAYDMSTLTLAQSFSVAGQEIYLTGMYISEDGLHLYVCGNQGNDVNEYTLSSAFDLTTASFTRSGISSSNIGGIFFSSDGTKFFRLSFSSASIYYWSLSTAWDISTASFVSAPTLTNKTTGCTAIAFNSDGTLLFVNDNTDDKIYSYTLSTGWDVSTLSYSEELSFASQASSTDAISFNADLTNMYLGVGDDFYKYSTSIESYTTSETWVNATTNAELPALQEAMATSTNQMNKTQLDAVPDANHFTLGDDLDLAVIFNMSSGTTVPSSDGVSINYDANALNQGAVLGTDYNWDFPATDKVRITSLAAQNLKVRIV